VARPRNPLLSRERIVAAALELVDTEGLAALSTRRLAAVLGVSGPSLYNHFATMDQLMDAVVDEVVGEVDLSMWESVDPGGWAGPVAAWARSYRAALVAHPNLVPALAHGPGRRPNSLRLADAVFGGLVDAGWARGDATRIGALMRYFVYGSALGSFAGGFVDDQEIYAAEYPHLGQAHLLAEHRRSVDEGAFEAGLTALVEGLSRQGPRRPTPGPSAAPSAAPTTGRRPRP
jgi:AcrR family transcriptional regulator